MACNSNLSYNDKVDSSLSSKAGKRGKEKANQRKRKEKNRNEGRKKVTNNEESYRCDLTPVAVLDRESYSGTKTNTGNHR